MLAPGRWRELQQPGIADSEFESDVSAFLRASYFSASVEGVGDLLKRPARPSSAKRIDTVADPKRLPSWLTDEDFAHHVGSAKVQQRVDKVKLLLAPLLAASRDSTDRIHGHKVVARHGRLVAESSPLLGRLSAVPQPAQ